MKYIMLPIHSNWVCSIMNGIKKIEVRSGTRLYNAINKLIKEQGKAPCLAYCTKDKDILLMVEDYDYGSMTYYAPKPVLIEKPTRKSSKEEIDLYAYYKNFKDTKHEWKLNGKVVAEFEASAEIISLEEQGDDDFGCNPWFYETATLDQDELVKLSCLDLEGFDEYLDGKDGTAIHIHNLKIFDKPKELADYGVKCSPQSWCYCEVEE